MTRQAYLNGEWIPDAGLSIPVADLGFAMGVTLTERLRTFEGRIWCQAEHMARMKRSAEIVGIDASAIDQIDSAITEYWERHASQREEGNDWAIIAFATPGQGGKPTCCVHGLPLPFQEWAPRFAEGVSLRTSDIRQTPTNCWPSGLKCRSRMHFYLADRQAQEQEPGARALLLDQEGFVGEATTANVVIYNEAEGIVSPRREKVLPGVTLAVLHDLAGTQGVPFTERDLTIEEFRAADEAWLSSTSVCLLPIVRCDGQPIGAGSPGPGYARMLSVWNEAVGLDIAAQAIAQAAS